MIRDILVVSLTVIIHGMVDSVDVRLSYGNCKICKQRPPAFRVPKPLFCEGTTPGTTPGITPETIPQTTPRTTPGTKPGMTPEIKSETTTGTTPGTTPGTTLRTTPRTTPGTKPGMTPEITSETTTGTTPGTTPGTTLRTTPRTTPGSFVRLVGGLNYHEGRVEIFLNNQWGTVCDDDWGPPDANVVCRQLGYPLGGYPTYSAYFGQGSGPILLDNVWCTGNERSLEQCSHNGIGCHNCGHHEDAGVVCREGSFVRLVGGLNYHEGRVEIFLNNQWGTVCRHGWGTSEANVVCRQLGYPSGGYARYSAYFGQGSGPILLDNVWCNGNERALEQCSHNGIGRHDCGHHEDAGVVCRRGSFVRLVGGLNYHEGRVEIFLNNQWGTVCNDGWRTPDANVVCRQLGYPSGVSVKYSPYVRQGPYLRQGCWQQRYASVVCTRGRT